MNKKGKVEPLEYWVAALAGVYATIGLKFFGAPEWVVLLFVVWTAYYGMRFYNIVRRR